MARYSVSRKQMRPKMRAFAWQYVWSTDPAIRGNGAGAARAAGYSERDAKDRAHMLLKHPLVKALVEGYESEKDRHLKGKAANVAEKLYEMGVAGDVPAATTFLKYAGKLKEKVEHDVSDSFADLVLGAQRERDAK